MKNKIVKLLTLFITNSTLMLSLNTFAERAETFSNVFTFGDSFAAADNSFAALITEHYGFKFTANQTNFAIGGATTSNLNSELASYKTNVKKFDSNALYMMYMGPSDINRIYTEIQLDMFDFLNVNNSYKSFYSIIDKLQNGSLKIQDFPKKRTVIKLATIEQNAGEFIKNIADSGAQYIVVLNHFNEFYRQSDAALIGRDDTQKSFFDDFLSSLLNNAIYNGINKFAPSANVIYVDYAKLVKEMISNPSDFFTANELLNTRKNQGVFDNTYHPTPAAQKITEAYILSVIESPSRIAYVREIPITVGENVAQNIRSKSYDLAMDDYEKFSGNINGEYVNFNTKSQTPKNLGIEKSDTYEIFANLNYKIKDNLVGGISVNGNKSRMNFKDNNGKADIKELLISLNTTYKFNNSIFLYKAIGAGTVKYDITRQIQLGQNTRNEHGKPQGVHYLATIGIGYQGNISSSSHLTPFLNVNCQKVSIKSYTEKGEARSTTMSFNIPNRKSVMLEIGTKIDGKFDVKKQFSVIPSLILTYGYEFIDPFKQQAKGQVLNMPRKFKVPTYKIDNSYFGINSELSAQTNNMNYGIRVGSKLSKNTKQWSAGLFYKYSL